MIGIIDYGVGNLRSVAKAVEYSGYESVITEKASVLDNCSHLILPGVGAFKDAIKKLKDSGLADTLIKSIQKGKPTLGICLGMQLLFESSREDGFHKGLALLEGSVERFDISLKVPHIGWNSVDTVRENDLLKGIDDMNFYFVHSYYLDKNTPSTLGVTDYEIQFTSCVMRDNLYGVQFHPEKSGDSGLKLLKNFGGMR